MTAFVNVSVISMDTERALSAQTVLVQGGHVTATGPAGKVRVPTDAETIDGHGKFLLPGLADMHVHLGDQSAEDNDQHLFLFLANGVTAVCDMHSTRSFGAVGNTRDNSLLALQREIARRQRLGPRDLYRWRPQSHAA